MEVEVIITPFPPDKGALIDVVGIAGWFGEVAEIKPGSRRSGQDVVEWWLGTFLIPGSVNPRLHYRQLMPSMDLLGIGDWELGGRYWLIVDC